MHFQTTPENLLIGINTAGRAVAQKSSLAVLSGILLEVENNQVVLTGSNMDLTISRVIPATMTVPGKVVLPTRQFSEIVRRLPGTGPVKCQITDREANSAELSYGRARVNLQTYDPDTFPRTTELGPNNQSTECLKVTASCAVFQDLFKRVVYAASQDDLRPIFTGVLLEITASEIKAVATDTHRLALNRVECPPGVQTGKVPGSSEFRVIISGRALGELVRILGQTENDEFIFTIAENYIAFDVGPTRLLSRLIAGDYPDYRKVIPSSYQTRIWDIDAQVLLRTVERAATLAREGLPMVGFSILPGQTGTPGGEGGLLSITAQSEAGSILEEIPIRMDGQPLETSFNAKYLEDALRWCETSELTVDFNGPNGPVIFRKDDYLALVLPVCL
jgi:DNA polymerase-3 subunit beta